MSSNDSGGGIQIAIIIVLVISLLLSLFQLAINLGWVSINR